MVERQRELGDLPRHDLAGDDPRALDDPAVLNWLNAVENEYELIAYQTDNTLTPWTAPSGVSRSESTPL